MLLKRASNLHLDADNKPLNLTLFSNRRTVLTSDCVNSVRLCH